MRSYLKRLLAVPPALAAMTIPAFASTGGGGGLPWDTPIQIIEDDLSGNVAHMLIVIAIVATGLMWAFGEHGSSMRKVMGIAAGGSIALGATSLISGLGLGSGAVIGGGATATVMLPLAGGLAALAFVALAARRTSTPE